MTQPVDIELNLDGNYTEGVQQATTATEGLEQAVSAVQAPARGLQRALDYATPTRAHLAAWGGFTAAAAYWQGQTSGIRATASAAGQSIRVLDGDVQRLARTFPLGTAGAVAMVQAVQGLGASEKQVGPLAATMERISGATSTFGPQMATSFGQLNREMASLDPSRVQRFGDVLTTVSAKSGASAQGIVDFAQAIAPVAQQAGIGESAVLGISSAFVKLGDDGGAAATAVSKILGDLNRSVREGSNDMVAYAQVTGMTVSNFKALYQANPSRALTAVTQAIAKAGPQGQMVLESLGLEGTRTQRALLQLSNSGGLGTAISQATSAYGNDSTAAAAKQAFGGLNDSLTELRSTVGQTADALGGPFLHVLTRITDLAKVGLAPVNAVLGSGAGQHVLGGLGALAITGMVARRVAAPLGKGALALQAATSSPIRSLAGGYALGRTEDDLAATEGMLTGRFGRGAAQAYVAGTPYGRGPMTGINRGVTQAGRYLGSFMADLRGGPVTSGGGTTGLFGGLGQAARTGFMGGSMGWEAWMRSFRDPLHQAFTPAGQRYSLLMPSRQFDPATGQAIHGAGGQQGAVANFLDARKASGMAVAWTRLQEEAGGTGRAMGRLATSTAAAARDVATFAARTAFAAGGTALKVGGSLVGGLASSALGMVGGGLGAALLGGGLLYGAYRNSQQSKSSEQDRVMNLDMYGTLNQYRDAMGQAGEAAGTLADQFAKAQDTVARGVKNMTQAQTVSGLDIQAAGPNPQPRSGQTIYRGSNAQIAGQISSLNLQGLQPGDVQAVKMDLLRQGIPQDRVNQILAQVDVNQHGRASASTITGLVGGVATEARGYRPSAREQMARDPLGVLAPGGDPWNIVGGSGLGSKPLVGDTGKKTLDLLQGAVMQQYADLSDHYNKGFAVQKSIRSTNTALREALKFGNPDTVAAVAQRMGTTLTGDKGFHVTAQAVRDAGGDITKLVGDRDIYGMSAADLRRAGVTASGPGIAAHLQSTGVYKNLQSIQASSLLPFFASGQVAGVAGAGQRAIGRLGQAPDDVSRQTAAVNKMVEAATKSGTSLSDLAVQATKATSVTSDWEQALLAAVAAEAQFEQSVRLQGAGRGTQIGAAVSTDLRTIAAGTGIGKDDPQYKAYTQARSDLASQRQSIIEFYQQRIMAQYQYQIASARAQEDYQRQVGRSEHDFYLSRQRAFSDFALQQRRQVQDAAGSLYNPYERIAATPVFDAYNLIGNEQEQLTAMRQQIQNIRKLKDLGIDDAVIRQLKLYDPNNAQQTAQLVTDLQNNQALVSKYDTVAQRRERLSGQLLSQSPEYQRQVADFKRTVSRQQTDFDTSQSRMRQDFLTQQTRMAQDLHTQDLQITNNMEQLSKDMADIIHGRFVHLHDQVVNSLQGLGRVVNRLWNPINQSLLHPGQQGSSSGAGGTVSSGISVTGSQSGGGFGNSAVGSSVGPVHTPGMHTTIGETTSAAKYVRPGTGQVYTGSTFDAEVPSDDFIKKHPADPNFNMSIAKQMMPEWSKGAQWKAWHDLWDAESHWNQYDHNNSDPNHMGQGAYGIPQAYPGHKMSASGKDWMTNPATQIKWGIGHIKGYGSPLDVARKMHLYNADGSYPSPQYIGYEYGGIATSPHLGMVAEKGKPEAMIPLNAHGMSFMVGALKQYIGTDAAKQISGGGMAYATHIDNSVHHYDNRADFRGSQIKVESNNPADLGKKLDQRAREANLTATRGVTWRPS